MLLFCFISSPFSEAALWVSGQDLRTSTSFIVACETCISVRTLAVWWSFTVLIMSIQSLCAGGPLCPAQRRAAGGRTEFELKLELPPQLTVCPFPDFKFRNYQGSKDQMNSAAPEVTLWRNHVRIIHMLVQFRPYNTLGRYSRHTPDILILYLTITENAWGNSRTGQC